MRAAGESDPGQDGEARSILERISKVFVLTATVLALILLVFLAGRGWLAWASAGVGLGTFALARIRPSLAMWIPFGTAFIAPGLLFVLTGAFYLPYLSVWMSAFLGAILALTDRRGWTLPAGWRHAVAFWALIVAVSWPLIFLREVDFTTQLVYRFDVRNAGGAGVVYLVLLWILHVALIHLLGLLWIDCALGRFRTVGFSGFTRQVLYPLGASWTIAILVALYQWLWDRSFATPGFWVTLGRIPGPMMDANPFGTVAALGGPLIATFIPPSLNPLTGRILGLGGLVLSWIGVWLSGSRSALALATIVAAWLVYKTLKQQAARSATAALVAGFAILALVSVFGMLLLRAPVTGPVARVRDLLRDRPPSEVLWRLWDRDRYGSTAVQAFLEFPFVGLGLGQFHHIGADIAHDRGWARLLPDNAQNWYRHQLAELGFIGSLGWIVCVFAMLHAMLQGARPGDKGTAGTLRVVIGAFAFISLGGMPAQDLAVTVTFWTLVCSYLLLTPSIGELRRGPSQRALWVAVCAVTVAYAAGTLYMARRDLRVPCRAARFDFDYGYGFVRAEGSPHVWVQDHAVIVPPALTRSLQLTLWSDAASEERPLSTEVSIDGTRVIRRTLRGSQPLVEVVSLPGENKRFVLEVDVDPASAGEPRPRLALQWEFLK